MNGASCNRKCDSALDSSFYKDESSSPSPVMKRSIEFKDELGEFEEDMWSPAISPIQSKCEDKSDDCDFVYISEILQASNYLPEDYDIFQWLEKQQNLKGNDTSGVSSLRRKLIYDTVSEILDRDREMPPWKVLSLSNSSIGKPSLHQIWPEFQRIRERDTVEDLPRKELLGDAISGWGDCPVEISEVTLDIERMIFKDLVGETIGDLVAFAGNKKSSARWFTDAKGIGKPF
ncbi:Protein LONGIFOLIA 1 [Camellia lanceoleosa]|uniref:Protein LONGIFOLIA 1 n=1 Tax=Camellia lanceoleosa TaxID=1840588 RepID=A0ACC0FRF1_9ERIC|nr:Protein LONGIFOLIA 1 [Camellia lanceoleosa]